MELPRYSEPVFFEWDESGRRRMEPVTLNRCVEPIYLEAVVATRPMLLFAETAIAYRQFQHPVQATSSCSTEHQNWHFVQSANDD